MAGVDQCGPARTTKLEFYASLTINLCHIVRLCDMWRSHTGQSFPFNRAIVSPLFLRNGILPILYQNRQQTEIMFDSGGFHAQQGSIDATLIPERLLDFYVANGWADRFVLPDYPISSFDSPAAVTRKISYTVAQYEQFSGRLPLSYQSKLVPVVHGINEVQVTACAQAAKNIAPRILGFGGFSTSGPKSSVNYVSRHSLRLLVHFAFLAAKWRVSSHAFGIGGTGLMCLLHYLPITSFDSAGWIRTAAYGNALIPFLGAVNVTGKAQSRTHMEARQFKQHCRRFGHSCAFCDDFRQLQRSWAVRALHNYSTVLDMLAMLSVTPAEQTLEILKEFNPRCAEYLRIVLDACAARPLN